jgi:hypothetical protein
MDYRYAGFWMVHVPYIWGKNPFVVPPVINRELMAALVESADDIWSDEVCPTNHRDSHRGKSLPL